MDGIIVLKTVIGAWLLFTGIRRYQSGKDKDQVNLALFVFWGLAFLL